MRVGRALGGLAVTITALSLMASAPAAAQVTDPLPVGEAKGVALKRERGVLVVVFTERSKSLHRKVAGRRVTMSCVELGPKGRFGPESLRRASTTFWAPTGRRARRLWTGDGSRGYDWCQVFLPQRIVRQRDVTHYYAARPIVAIPLTQRGAVYIDEERRAWRLSTLLSLAEIVADEEGLDGLPTAAQLLDALGPWHPLSRRLIPLAAPSDTPPPGRIGYYGDGAENVAIAVLSASGRRLFLEVGADDVLHTNVIHYLEKPQLR
jgi:hypothetical protein